MKRQFVNQLEDGDTVNDYFVAVRKDLRDTQTGNKFLGCVFKDRTGEIGGMVWKNATGMAGLFEIGQVVNVRAAVTTYRDRLQLRVDQILPLREGEYDKADLVHVPENIREMAGAFWELLETIEQPALRLLVQTFKEDGAFAEQFLGAAAGKGWHHAHRGGLLQHCLELARMVDAVCVIYPQLNRDILLAGVLLHDIGKIEEMSQDLHIEYTTAGKLVGHVAQGVLIAQRRMDAIPDFPEELRLHLLHIVVSHHGEYAHGASVLPKTPEAIAFSKLDDLSAQVDAFTRVIGETQDKGDEWSPFLPLIDRQVHAKRPAR